MNIRSHGYMDAIRSGNNWKILAVDKNELTMRRDGHRVVKNKKEIIERKMVFKNFCFNY